jgi:cytosol alanyl aminopeptidase
LSVLAEEDPKMTDAMIAKYKSSREGRERQSYLGALARVQDDKQAAKVRALLKTKEIRGNEIELVLYARTGNDATRDSGWSWVKQDIATLMTRLADDRRSNLPGLVDDYCTAATRADVAEFFSPTRLQSMRGAARTLAQTLETIDLCAALKDRQGKNLTGYFAAGSK